MKRVYFARRASGEGPIKIGCSVYPEARRKQLSCDHKAPMVLLAEAPGGFREEGRLHRQFAAARIEGEWFKPTERLLSAIAFVQRTGKLPPAPAGDREIVFARRYLAGDTLDQIGSDHGITRERVRQILRRAGIPTLGRRPTCAAAQNVDRIAALAREGKTLKEIAAEIGDTYHNVQVHALRLGIKSRRARKPRMEKTLDRAVVAARLYNAGAKTRDIARQIGIPHQSSIYRLLRIQGIEPTRKPRRAA